MFKNQILSCNNRKKNLILSCKDKKRKKKDVISWSNQESCNGKKTNGAPSLAPCFPFCSSSKQTLSTSPKKKTNNIGFHT